MTIEVEAGVQSPTLIRSDGGESISFIWLNNAMNEFRRSTPLTVSVRAIYIETENKNLFCETRYIAGAKILLSADERIKIGNPSP